jgi:hypothetical protein
MRDDLSASSQFFMNNALDLAENSGPATADGPGSGKIPRGAAGPEPLRANSLLAVNNTLLPRNLFNISADRGAPAWEP